MHRTQVYFKEDQHLLLKREAVLHGQSLTDYLRDLIDKHLLAIKRPLAPNLGRITALGASRAKDASRRHDEVFARMASSKRSI